MQFYTGKSRYLSPSQYIYAVVQSPLPLADGSIIPMGTRLIDLFPDGIKAVLDPGNNEVISIENSPVVDAVSEKEWN